MGISFVNLQALWYGYAVWSILCVFDGGTSLHTKIPLLCEMKHCIVSYTISLYCENFTSVSLCPLYYAVCRKCINKKINDEDLDHCPVCKIDLGCTPAEKLRYSSRDISLYESIMNLWETIYLYVACFAKCCCTFLAFKIHVYLATFPGFHTISLCFHWIMRCCNKNFITKSS